MEAALAFWGFQSKENWCLFYEDLDENNEHKPAENIKKVKPKAVDNIHKVVH
jgi:hypothetical protein